MSEAEAETLENVINRFNIVSICLFQVILSLLLFGLSTKAIFVTNDTISRGLPYLLN